MAELKTEFDLINVRWKKGHSGRKVGKARIIGQGPQHDPYLAFEIGDTTVWMEDDETERFAINILKALKSKHLKKINS